MWRLTMSQEERNLRSALRNLRISILLAVLAGLEFVTAVIIITH
jgi:hypothetical protein